jgi:NAD(P)-dependent dehydrogenase (short-subunit alcohol dehydrogenase family)
LPLLGFHVALLSRPVKPGTVDVTDTRVVPVRLDITNPGDVATAARDCTDVSLVVNNAGAMLQTLFLSAPNMSAARTEMETNYFGALAMARAFDPVMAAAGGRHGARPWSQARAQRCRASPSRSCLRMNARAPQQLIAAGKSWAS